jgi:hypothetical protein
MESTAHETTSSSSYEPPSIEDIGSFVDLTLGAVQKKKTETMGNSTGAN